MDSFAEPASFDVYISIEELAEELEYQKVLLISLNNVANREATEAAIRGEISRLENQIRTLTQCQRGSAAMPEARSYFTNAFDDDPFNSAPASCAPGNSGLPVSTNLGANSFLGPSQLGLPTRKRSHDEPAGFSDYANKSRRTSPSTFVTRSVTPSGGPGHDNSFLEDVVFDLTEYSDDDAIARELEKVRQRQKDAENKARLEKADAEYARQLYLGTATDLAPSRPSAWDRVMGRQSSSSSQPALLGPAFGQSSSPDIESGLTASSNSISATGVYTSPSFLPRMASSFPEPNFDSDIEQMPVIELGEDEFQHPSSYLELPPHSQTFNPYEGPESVYPQNQPHAFAQEAYIPTSVSSNTTNANISLGPLSTANSGMGHSEMSGYTSLHQLGAVISNACQTFSTGFGNSLGTIDMSSFDPSAGTMHQTANRSDTPNESSQPRNWGPTDFYADPQKKAQEIQGLLENIRPDVEILKEDREGTPDGLKYPLYEHQKLALTWLKSMEEGTNKGGILADDMGLGKTITTLALILSRPSNDRVRKTTLIVGPVALVRQWAREIETKIQHSDRLSTFLYHTGKRVTWETLRSFDIVLTTYGKLGAEHKRKEEWEAKLIADPDMDQSGVHTMFPLLSHSAKWYRVILDEAQFIKNKATRAARGACELKSMTRICLTGTPMMNGIHELYSLVNFLRIKPYNEYRRFTDDFGYLFRNPTSGALCSRHQQESAMKKFQAVLKAILLRRTKKSKIDGQPILTLPEKTEVIVHGVFNEDEQDYYTALEAGARLTFNKYLKAGTIGKNYSNILVLLLRLRQAACHPHLIMDFEEAPVEAPAAEMEVWAKTLLPDVVRRILNATFPFECPVCYDPVPNPRFAIPCGHETCSECLVRITSNSQDEGIRGGTEAQNAKCPTCRGSIDIKRVIDYETFKKVHVIDYAGEANVQNGDTLSEESWDGLDELSSTDETESEGDCGSEASDDIENFIVPDDYNSSDESDEDKDGDKDSNEKVNVKAKMNSTQLLKGKNFKSKTKEARVKFEDAEDSDDDNNFVEIKDMKSSGSTQLNGGRRSQSGVSLENPKRSKSKSKKAKKHKSEDKVTPAKHTSLAQLKKEAMKNAEGRRRYMKYLRRNWVSSAKVDKCLEILKNTNPSTKTIVFSQFTTLLDLLEIPIRGEKWAFERYDGSMTAGARHNAVVKFTDDPGCKIMLVSLKAGNAGLNLVAASQVIILDPFWNPFIEMQAVDRAHRIGQLKPVTVHRILIGKTVEDRIIELQKRKREVIDAALDENASRGIGRLGHQELIYLFNGPTDVRETAPRPVAQYNFQASDMGSTSLSVI